MTRHRALLVVAAALAFAGTAIAQQPLTGRNPDEIAVLAADALQRDAVASGDAARISAQFHPSFLVNAPNNRVMTRDEVARMAASGEIRNDNWIRVPERVSVTGDVAVVMGRESLVTAAGSEQAQAFGAGRSLERRFTNVYLRSQGEWRLLARHAHVVTPPPAGASK